MRVKQRRSHRASSASEVAFTASGELLPPGHTLRSLPEILNLLNSHNNSVLMLIFNDFSTSLSRRVALASCAWRTSGVVAVLSTHLVATLGHMTLSRPFCSASC